MIHLYSLFFGSSKATSNLRRSVNVSGMELTKWENKGTGHPVH